MVHMPPGAAKSLYGSVLFPPWAMAQRDRVEIIGASNTGAMAETFSRRIMSTVRGNAATLGYSLVREAAELWETTTGGTYRAAGVGAAIAGRRADGAIIDDPVRSREDVESEGNREKQWAWFMGDLRTRLKPEAWLVVIMTRWHLDDLGGRLLERQPGLWRVINLPAQAEVGDPLGRKAGEWLWADDDYGYAASLQAAKAEYEAGGAMRDWAALYQQRPVPLEGSLFKTVAIPILEAASAGGASVRAWDLAATAQTSGRDPDWTAGVKLTRVGSATGGRLVVDDVVRVRGSPDEVEGLIRMTAARDGYGVRIGLPQDPGQAGKQQVLYLTRALAGHVVEAGPESGDKMTRAAPVAAQVNVGALAVVRASWNAAFLDELAAFPVGTHDDQVDALSRAFAMTLTAPTPLLRPEEIARAAGRKYQQHDCDPFARILGVAVELSPDDPSVVVSRQGPVVFTPRALRGVTAEAGAAQVGRIWKDWEADGAFIDASGGVSALWRANLAAANRQIVAVGFDVDPIGDGQFVDRRAEMWSALAAWVREVGQLPDCPELIADLAQARLVRDGDKLAVEFGAGRSPRWGEALALTFAAPVAKRGGERRAPAKRSDGYDPFARFLKG
jgi:predicted phage terminase large subunit-like protein